MNRQGVAAIHIHVKFIPLCVLLSLQKVIVYRIKRRKIKIINAVEMHFYAKAIQKTNAENGSQISSQKAVERERKVKVSK